MTTHISFMRHAALSIMATTIIYSSLGAMHKRNQLKPYRLLTPLAIPNQQHIQWTPFSSPIDCGDDIIKKIEQLSSGQTTDHTIVQLSQSFGSHSAHSYFSLPDSYIPSPNQERTTNSQFSPPGLSRKVVPQSTRPTTTGYTPNSARAYNQKQQRNSRTSQSYYGHRPAIPPCGQYSPTGHMHRWSKNRHHQYRTHTTHYRSDSPGIHLSHEARPASAPVSSLSLVQELMRPITPEQLTSEEVSKEITLVSSTGELSDNTQAYEQDALAKQTNTVQEAPEEDTFIQDAVMVDVFAYDEQYVRDLNSVIVELHKELSLLRTKAKKLKPEHALAQDIVDDIQADQAMLGKIKAQLNQLVNEIQYNSVSKEMLNNTKNSKLLTQAQQELDRIGQKASYNTLVDQAFEEQSNAKQIAKKAAPQKPVDTAMPEETVKQDNVMYDQVISNGHRAALILHQNIAHLINLKAYYNPNDPQLISLQQRCASSAEMLNHYNTDLQKQLDKCSAEQKKAIADTYQSQFDRYFTDFESLYDYLLVQSGIMVSQHCDTYITEKTTDLERQIRELIDREKVNSQSLEVAQLGSQLCSCIKDSKNYIENSQQNIEYIIAQIATRSAQIHHDVTPLINALETIQHYSQYCAQILQDRTKKLSHFCRENDKTTVYFFDEIKKLVRGCQTEYRNHIGQNNHPRDQEENSCMTCITIAKKLKKIGLKKIKPLHKEIADYVAVTANDVLDALPSSQESYNYHCDTFEELEKIEKEVLGLLQKIKTASL